MGRTVLRLVPGGLSAPGALRLGEDPTLPEAAEALGIALTTTRSQLGQLFDKTGTRTQLALALRLARALDA